MRQTRLIRPLGPALRMFNELGELRAAFIDWPAIAAKGFLWKHFRLPQRETKVHSRGGATMLAPLVRNVGALYTAVDVFALKAYEHEWELEEEPVVVDIGANVGAWVVWLSEKRPGLKGTSYEPDLQAAAYLRRNLELNGLADRVEVREEAVSDRTGTARLFQARPGDGTSSLSSVSHAAKFERDSVVPTVSFDDVVGRIEGEISLAKIDCEGAEYDIVGSSSPEAWNRVKRVVIEYHPAPADKLDALRARLGELGYTVVRERQRSGDEGTLWLVRADD